MRKATKRVDVRVTPAEKTRITQAARDAGISTWAYMRRAAAAYCPPEDAAMVEEMFRRLTESTQRASAAVDSALAWIEASNRRIAQMEHGLPQPLVH
jgi:uncharacterized protein (DUF1778 family)